MAPQDAPAEPAPAWSFSTLHAAWTPGRRPQAGRLFVWAEGEPHRGQTFEPLSARVAGDALAADPGIGAVGATRRRRLRLPGQKGRALSSRAQPTGPLGTVEVTQEGLDLTPLECLRALPRLPVVGPGSSPIVAPSLAAWARAAQLALDLLVRQRYLPHLEEIDGEGFALWRPVLADTNDATRVGTVARALPGVALMLAPDRPAGALVEDFLAALVDAGVRAACAGARLEETAPPEGVGAAWTRALFSNDALIEARPLQAFSKLERLVADWAAPVAEPAAFRTCLRLDPPSSTDDGAWVEEPAAGWTVRYGLQSVDEPSLLVPAETVWRAPKNDPFGGRGPKNPQESMLQGLGIAARLWPRLGSSLDTPRPASAELSADEAAEFARDVAPRLADAGLGVLLPGIRPLLAALQANLRAKPKRTNGSDGAAAFGLDALVQYDLELALSGTPLTPEDLEALVELKTPLVRIRGQWVSVAPGDMDAVRRLWQRRQELTLREALQLVGSGTLEGVPIATVEADGWLRSLLDPQTHGAVDAAPPPGLHATLRPYQASGVRWLLTLRRLGLGALLADDMGLGKTLQVLACELAVRRPGDVSRPTLVVCPASVATNWRLEAQRFTPELGVLVHHGPDRAKGRAFERAVKSHDIVVTTYALLARDLDDLGTIPWAAVVLDEAQNVKNPTSRQAQAARALRADWRAAMTGTPVENRLAELWSIYHFLNPGYLGHLSDFRRAFAVPVERYGDAHATARLTRLVRPFMIRRLKTDPAVAGDLPEKIESTVYAPLTREQATLYESVVRDALGRIERSEGIERRGVILAMITRLKQVCNHPAHLLADGSALSGRSGKLDRLVELLEEALAEGDRCLLFTQFREMGDLLRRHLGERFGAVAFLHGGTPRRERDEMVARFQSGQGPALFLLSLKAGGTGLNLTAASRVFHYDRWWNPAVEDQATDRAYRIGQHRTVHVHKFVCRGTLEERIDATLRDKRALADRIVGAGEAWITEMSNADLRRLLELRPDAVEEA